MEYSGCSWLATALNSAQYSRYEMDSARYSRYEMDSARYSRYEMDSAPNLHLNGILRLQLVGCSPKFESRRRLLFRLGFGAVGVLHDVAAQGRVEFLSSLAIGELCYA